ncbi:MAG TPA: sigma-70 family RNA polymerase sigma factor [Candidatus Acidoferrum sp.]|nr:sigma-70 family RNA polymerase sigma factor [Candidatus Acidoferrum sp.]
MMQGQAPALTDAQLVADIQNGQTQAEAELYRKYHAKVYYVALRESRSPHDAEDVCAETFLRALQVIRRKELRSTATLPAFILGTTRNVLYELFSRRKQAGKTTDPEDADLSMPSHEKLFLDSEVQQAIKQTMGRLKPREQDILRMHFYEELPAEEIARRFGIARERVRLVKSRALQHFREVYKRLDAATGVKKLDTRQGSKLT